MVDPTTAIERLGEAALVVKLLGPTADYIGAGVQQWTERATHNVQRVFAFAAAKLGPELETEGTVPPRVLKGILEEAQFSDDELTAEYLGGVLASSRTSVARDDRGASLVALVGRLSTYQLRCHYILYESARRVLAGADVNLGMSRERTAKKLFAPLTGFVRALDLNEEEFEDFNSIFSHVVHGLIREELIGNEFSFGNPEHLRSSMGNRDYANGGLVYTVAPLGIELFCAAHGVRGELSEAFLDPGVDFVVAKPDIEIGEGFALVADLPTWISPDVSTADG